MAYHGKKLVDLKGTARADRIKQLLANPGTRKLVPTADLPSSYRQQRELNTRLNAPIVAGSSMTNRDLAHQREAAVNTQFGPNAVGASQFREQQTNAWFDEYQRQMAQHRTNTAADQAQAQAQIANLGNVTGPAGSAPVDAQNQDVAAKAAAIRSTFLGAQKGQLLGQGQAATTYADTLANVVAPGQKVQALSQATGATDALKQKIGAFRTQFEGAAKTSEGKNVLAQQALGLNTAKAQTTAQQGQERINLSAQTAKSTAHDRAVRRQQTAASKATQLNKFGYTADEWASLSSGQKSKARAGKGAKPPKPVDPATQNAKDFYNKYGVKPAATAAVGNAKNEIQSARSLVNTIRKSNPQITRQQLGQLLLNGQAGSTKKGQESMAIPKVKGLWATVALDLWKFNGQISAGTADKLHRAGYSVKTLGLNTGSPTVVGPKSLPASKK